jgi:hypothetical protein
MFNTSSRLDQRFTGVLFCAITAVGVIAVGGAAFDDRVDPMIMARSPAAAPVVLAASSSPAAAESDVATLTGQDTATPTSRIALATSR